MLKKKCIKKNGISFFQIKDSETNKVTSFYKKSPFPNYKLNDNKSTILDKGDKNYLTSRFKKFIGFNKDILEVGCGTGQFTNYFAIGTNNRVVGLDPTIESIELAAKFSNENSINNIRYVNARYISSLVIVCGSIGLMTPRPWNCFISFLTADVSISPHNSKPFFIQCWVNIM